MYEVSSFLKFAEEDSFNEGCLPDSGTTAVIDMSFSADTVASLVDQLGDAFGVKNDAISIDACDEPGRIDIQRMETDNGDEPTEHQRAEWKEGRMRLWAVTFSGNVEYVNRETVRLEGRP